MGKVTGMFRRGAGLGMILALGALAGAWLLGGCQSADPLPADTILQLKLNDSLSRYDSVVITILDRQDMTNILETVWHAPLPAPSQMQGHVLTKAKDRDFIVRVAGYASRDQLRLETLIFYEGGRKTVVHQTPPPYQPVNQLISLTPSAGKLSPNFKEDSLFYRVIVPAETKTVTLSLQPALGAAQMSVDGIPVAAGTPSPAITMGTTPDTVKILVTDASQGAAYTRQYQVVLNPTLPAEALFSAIIPSVGTLSPPFSPTNRVYSLSIPATADHVTFVLHPADPKTMTMIFMGQGIFDGEQSRQIDVPPGGSNVADMEVYRGSSHSYYQITIDRPDLP